MAKNKTVETQVDVTDFINSVADPAKREDSFRIIEIMKQHTGFEPKMWGPSIVGFGSYHYKYDSGHEGDAPLVGFSPRAAAISLYLYTSFPKKEELLERFGKYKAGAGCIYIKKLKDIDIDTFAEMISESVAYLTSKYPSSPV